MFIVMLGIFIVCTCLETLGECCNRSNIVANLNEEASPMSLSGSGGGFKVNAGQDDDEFTVHYERNSKYNKKDMLS